MKTIQALPAISQLLFFPALMFKWLRLRFLLSGMKKYIGNWLICLET